jgi:hypothetical protein
MDDKMFLEWCRWIWYWIRWSIVASGIIAIVGSFDFMLLTRDVEIILFLTILSGVSLHRSRKRDSLPD